MKCIATAVGTLCVMLAATGIQAQDQKPTPPPELKKLDVWIGDWTLSGTARDLPDRPEYNLHWSLHEHWVLNGFFMIPTPDSEVMDRLGPSLRPSAAR